MGPARPGPAEKWAVPGIHTGVDFSFKTFLAAVEGLLLPDKPSLPGASRINMSLYPRSRYRANPHLRPPRPAQPTAPGPATPESRVVWSGVQ